MGSRSVPCSGGRDLIRQGFPGGFGGEGQFLESEVLNLEILAVWSWRIANDLFGNSFRIGPVVDSAWWTVMPPKDLERFDSNPRMRPFVKNRSSVCVLDADDKGKDRNENDGRG